MDEIDAADQSLSTSTLFGDEEDFAAQVATSTPNEGDDSDVLTVGENAAQAEENLYVPADLVPVRRQTVDHQRNDQAGLVIEQPTINMEIDLARIQQPGFLSPVIILNNNLLMESVPEAQATIEIVDEGEGNIVRSGSREAARPGSIDNRTASALMAATMEGPIVLIEDTLRVGNLRDTQAGPSAVRIAAETPRSRKRRRIITPAKPASPPASAQQQYDDDDDGTICSICLDSWTMTGEHRLVALKCGHLFGYMCIKRWLQDNPMQSRCCATCKTKAHMRDIRYLYARVVKAVDNSEEIKLRQQLDEEKLRLSKLSGELQVSLMELKVQRKVTEELRAKLKEYEQRGTGEQRASLSGEVSSVIKAARIYKISLDKTMDICREPGCRVMAYGSKKQHLLVSQKSTQNLFPGYSIKFIDIPAFQHSSVFHISNKMIRDITIDIEDELFAAATSEKSVKLFTCTNRAVTLFTPSEANIWSCAFDRERSKFLYLGTQSGSVFVYDIRNPNHMVEEFGTEGDCSPIINICPVSPTSSIPFGGFLVCKLTSCWFFEYTAAQRVDSTRLNVDGPFTAMNYSEKTGYIMLTTRPGSRHPRARYILASLVKFNSICVLHIVQTISGSKVEPNMIRSAQICLDEQNTLVAAYLQDDRQLATWSSSKGNQRLQSLPVTDVLWDLCPMYADNQTFLAALSDSKCRAYRVYSE